MSYNSSIFTSLDKTINGNGKKKGNGGQPAAQRLRLGYTNITTNPANQNKRKKRNAFAQRRSTTTKKTHVFL